MQTNQLTLQSHQQLEDLPLAKYMQPPAEPNLINEMLPSEILNKIFSHSTIPDVENIRLVNRQWSNFASLRNMKLLHSVVLPTFNPESERILSRVITNSCYNVLEKQLADFEDNLTSFCYSSDLTSEEERHVLFDQFIEPYANILSNAYLSSSSEDKQNMNKLLLRLCNDCYPTSEPMNYIGALAFTKIKYEEFKDSPNVEEAKGLCDAAEALALYSIEKALQVLNLIPAKLLPEYSMESALAKSVFIKTMETKTLNELIEQIIALPDVENSKKLEITIWLIAYFLLGQPPAGLFILDELLTLKPSINIVPSELIKRVLVILDNENKDRIPKNALESNNLFDSAENVTEKLMTAINSGRDITKIKNTQTALIWLFINIIFENESTVNFCLEEFPKDLVKSLINNLIITAPTSNIPEDSSLLTKLRRQREQLT